jgi:hypothetical protein
VTGLDTKSDKNLEKQKEELRKILESLPTEKEREKLAVRLLGEKYGEEFEVLEVRPISFPFTHFKLICYPVENPGLLFEVRLSLDGKSIHEGYAVQKVCTRLADKLREKVSDEECEVYIRVESVKKEIPETDMPLDDFLNAYSTNKYRIVLFYTSSGQREIPETVFKEILDGEERLSGVIRAYCLPEKEYADALAYAESHDRFYMDFDEKLKGFDPVDIVIENGKMH